MQTTLRMETTILPGHRLTILRAIADFRAPQ